MDIRLCRLCLVVVVLDGLLCVVNSYVFRNVKYILRARVVLHHEAEVPVVVYCCNAVGKLCIHDTFCLLPSFTGALGAFCPQVVFGVADGTLHDLAVSAFGAPASALAFAFALAVEVLRIVIKAMLAKVPGAEVCGKKGFPITLALALAPETFSVGNSVSSRASVHELPPASLGCEVFLL